MEVFMKMDLKDGMVVKFRNGYKYIKINDRVLNSEGFVLLKHLTNFLYHNENCCKEWDVMEVFKINTESLRCLDQIFDNRNLETVWRRSEAIQMTAEEMRDKLEKLTNERIEIIPNRIGMIDSIAEYCESVGDCNNCIIKEKCVDYGNFSAWDIDKIKECYNKIINK